MRIDLKWEISSMWAGIKLRNNTRFARLHRIWPHDCSAWIHDGSAYFAGRFRRRHVPFYRGCGSSGPIGCFQFSVGAREERLNRVLRHTGFSLVRESGMKRDEGSQNGQEKERRESETGYERKRNIETGGEGVGGRGWAEKGGRGGRRARPTRTFVTRHQTRVPPVGDSSDRL